MSGTYTIDPFFAKLVQNDKDTIGLVAYALYKNDEIEYCKAVDSKLEEFIRVNSTEARILELRKRGVNNAASFAQAVLDNSVNETITKQTEILENIVKRHTKRRFIDDLGVNLACSFIFALILAVAAFIAQYQGLDISINVNGKPATENAVPANK